MEEKSTEKLYGILTSGHSRRDFKAYQEQIKGLPVRLSDYFSSIMNEHGLSASDIVKASELPESYAYQILNGTKKNPARDKILALCIGAKMNLAEIKRALEIAGCGILYSKNPRDAAIIFCIKNNKYRMYEINEFLSDSGLELLTGEKEKREPNERQNSRVKRSKNEL